MTYQPKNMDFFTRSNEARKRQMERITEATKKKEDEYKEQKCSKCWRIPSEKQIAYSKSVYDEVLCWGHQPDKGGEE